MTLNTPIVIMILALAVLVSGIMQAQRLRKMIRCRYSSKSKQTYEKFVKAAATIVIFENKPFYIIPSCVTHHWFTKGISQLFPQFMPEISFTWESQFPVDPNTGKVVIVDSAIKNIMRAQENMANYAGSQQAAVMQGRKAQGMLERFMPIIAIGAVLVAIYAVYMVMQMKANDKITQQAIIDIYNTFNAHGTPVIPVK